MSQKSGLSLKIADKVDPLLKKLFNIWDSIGISEEQQTARHDAVLLHIVHLLEEMVAEEEGLRKRLKENIEKYSQKLDKLCKEMDLPNFEMPKLISLPMLDKNIRSNYDDIKKKKCDRLSEYNKLIDEDQQLSRRMNLSPLQVTVDSVPKPGQLAHIRALVQERRQEMNKRQQNYDALKEKIVGFAEVLSRTPETRFEQDVIFASVDSFILSLENMESLKEYHNSLELQLQANKKFAACLLSRLKLLSAEIGNGESECAAFVELRSGFSSETICALQEEVKRLESLKEQKEGDVVREAQEKLRLLWDRCFYSQEQKNSYQHLCQCDYKVVNVDDIMKEIEKVQAYYEKHKILLDKINRYQETFKEFIQTEHKSVHPDRLYTGSSNFLLEEKARSRLTKEITELEQDALSAVELWEKRTGCLFLVNGSRFKDHVKTQWQEFKAERAEEQIRQLKAKVAKSEATTPGKNLTPGKRHLIDVTPNKISSKFMKFETYGTRSAPHACGFSGSPFQHRAEVNGGYLMVRDPRAAVKAKVNPSSPLPYNKNVNHGCLFASIPKQPSPAKVHEGKNRLLPSNGIKTTTAKRNLWTVGKPSSPSVKCYEISENVNPFSSAAVISGIQSLPESACESAPTEQPSYEEFREGLSDSGKENFCNSIISSK